MIFQCFILLIFFYIDLTQAIQISLAANSLYINNGDIYNTLVNEFNKYSKENKLDIELDMILFSDQNITYELQEYGSTIDSLLLRKSKKHDIYCFDPLYTIKYSPNLLDLGNELPKEHIDLYSSSDAKKVGVYNNKWVGLVRLKHKIKKNK